MRGDKPTNSAEPADLVSEVLSTMRVAGSVLLNKHYCAPWGIALPDSETMRAMMGFAPGTDIVAFHLLREGTVDVTAEDGATLRLESGEAAMVFGGVAHVLSLGSPTQPMPLDVFLGGIEAGQSPDNTSQRQNASRLVCGAFVMRHMHLNPLLSALPPIARVSADTNEDSVPNDAVAQVVRQLVSELESGRPGSDYAVQRLLELLCIAAVRQCVNAERVATERGANWLLALRDPPVSAALAAVHASPGNRWTVDTLAERANLSRSRFAERFGSTVGMSPMQYVTRWRMNTAARLLGESGLSPAQAAAEVGYEDVTSFGRAFKQHIGTTPAAYR